MFNNEHDNCMDSFGAGEMNKTSECVISSEYVLVFKLIKQHSSQTKAHFGVQPSFLFVKLFLTLLVNSIIFHICNKLLLHSINCPLDRHYILTIIFAHERQIYRETEQKTSCS